MTTSRTTAAWRTSVTLLTTRWSSRWSAASANGLNLQASYTWSKNLTDADSLIPFSYTTNNQREQAQDTINLRNDKAVSVQNIPQNFTISYLYQLPFGKGRKWLNNSRALDLLIGGWQVGAIQHYSSGQPIDFGCATGIPYYQNCIEYTLGPASLNGTDFASPAYKANKNGPSFFNQQSWFKPAYRVPGTNGTNDPGVPMSQAAFVDQNREGPGWPRGRTLRAAGHRASPCSFAPFALGNIDSRHGGHHRSAVHGRGRQPAEELHDQGGPHLPTQR